MMIRKAIIAILWTLLAVAISPSACTARTWFVSPRGSDASSGTSAAPFATLYKAVSVVDPGDTVDLDGGTYKLSYAEQPYSGNPVVIARGGAPGKPVTIQSTPGQRAVVDASSLWLGTGDGIDVCADYVTVQNLTVENAPVIDLTVQQGSFCTVQRCTFVGGVWGGVEIGDFYSLAEMTNDAILDCNVHDNSTVNINGTGANWGGGLGMSNCTNSTVRDNAVYHNWGEGLTTGAWNGYPCSSNTIEGNTVYDNWSVELYLNCAQNTAVFGNFIYADSAAPLRGGYPAIGIAVDNEATTYLGQDCSIYDNIVIGGMESFRYANTNTYSGFYDGGLNGFTIENNVFSNTSPYNTGAFPACVQIDNDPNNNFSWINNIVWERKSGVQIAYDGGGGTQTLSNNCWAGSGGRNMSGAGDIDMTTRAPGFTDPYVYSPSGWTLFAKSPCRSAGANLSAQFDTGFDGATRPDTGAWTMGAFAAQTTPAPAFVQAMSNDPVSALIVPVVLSSPQTAGDMNIVVIGCNTRSAVLESVTDSNGNAYRLAAGPTTGYAQRQWIFYAPNISAGADTVNVVFTGAVDYPDIRVLEYAGVGTLDGWSASRGNGATARTAPLTTTSPRELVFVADTCYPSTTGVGSGYTTRLSTIDGDIAADKSVDKQGLQTVAATLAGSNYWLMQMVTFK